MNDELRDLCITFGQVTSYSELLVRENAKLKRKLKGKVKARPRTMMMNQKMKMRVTAVK